MTAVCFSQTALSVPAYPYLMKVQQADGSYVTVVKQGDEHGHILLTEDGHPLFFNSVTSNYEYASLSRNGAIGGSGIIATETGKRNAAAKAYLNTQDTKAIWDAFAAERQQRVAKAEASRQTTTATPNGPRRIRINDYPTTGDQHSLVILVEFSDKAFTTVGDDAHTFYDNMLNQENFTYRNGAHNSARDFYIASSNGLFTPTFDVVGPVKLPKSYSYYGANLGNSDNMKRLEEFVRTACTQADPLVDYSKYDTNKDGYVDNIYFFYAGYGEADSKYANTIWPHAFKYDQFDETGQTHLTLDGVRIGSYSCSNEINGQREGMPTGIGTFVHEFGHVLGLGDHYDVNYSSACFTPGSFDTMDQGSYNDNMNTPPSFSGYERGELGWLDYTELNAGTDTINVLPDLKDSNKAYRISVPGTNGREFYVLENRQQKGWDKFLPGHGMLMWHIDIDTLAWDNNTINSVGSHQRVDLVEADNRKTAASREGDPFPGAANVTKWDIKSWANKKLLSLDDIEETDSMIYLMLGGLDLTLATPTVTVTEQQDSSIVLSWPAVPMARKYILSAYQLDGDKKTVLDNYRDTEIAGNNRVCISGLASETDYEFDIVAQRGSYKSDTASVKASTTAIPFEKLLPVASLAADGDKGNSVTARWEAVKDADSYVVTLSEHDYSSEVTTRGYDFSDKAAGMPSLWQYTGSFLSMTNYCGKAAPALRWNTDGDHILVAYPDTRISSISFWARGTASTRATVDIETCHDGQWNVAETIQLASETDAEAKTYQFSFAPADSVRLVYHRTASSFFIDDVEVGCNDVVRLPVAGYTDKNVGNALSYTFSQLKSGVTYGFTVYAQQGDKKSYTSKEQIIKLDETTAIGQVTADKTASQAAAIYDLNGRRVADSRLAKGVYILKQDGQTRKVIIR